jgi:ferrochelatase
MQDGEKIAIVLFNLGGPDGPDAVKPFLRNLFRDPAIIGAPGPVREGLAWLISTLREKPAQENYAKMGGGSPLLPATEAQAMALGERVGALFPAQDVRVFPAMRYWHPFIKDVVTEVEAWQADKIVLLPLYPQFSTTTTGSSLKAWIDAGGADAHSICCYPRAEGFVAAHADLIRQTWEQAGRPEKTRLLFSAHGLPEKTIAAGDPYQWQVEQTAKAVAEQLPDLPDWRVCYQSRVGPMKWIGPSTDDAIREAAEDGLDIVLTPIAFVSEHIETLVELDEEYGDLARSLGVANYHRVPALSCHPQFIESLARLVAGIIDRPRTACPATFGAQCPIEHSACGRTKSRDVNA